MNKAPTSTTLPCPNCMTQPVMVTRYKQCIIQCVHPTCSHQPKVKERDQSEAVSQWNFRQWGDIHVPVPPGE